MPPFRRSSDWSKRSWPSSARDAGRVLTLTSTRELLLANVRQYRSTSLASSPLPDSGISCRSSSSTRTSAACWSNSACRISEGL